MKFFTTVSVFAMMFALAFASDDDSSEQVDSMDEPINDSLEKHPGADYQVLFTKPGGVRLVSGQDAQILVGFINRASEDLFIDSLDASFRLAGDHNSVIQNLSAIAYNKKLAEGQEASLFYQFHVDNVFTGMPIGLEVSLMYRDSAGRSYRDAVFNSTLTVEESDVAFDVETFFLYVFLAACVVIGGVFLMQCLSPGAGRRSGNSGRAETGTKDNGVDYAWLPSTVLKTQGGSKPNSPRQRKNTKA